MQKHMTAILAAAALASATAARAADEPDAQDGPSKVAATRQELKEQLERSKESRPRLPLPPPTEAEIAEAKARAESSRGAGLPRGMGGGIVNNGRLRQLHLDASLLGPGASGSREPDPAMSVDNTFKTMLFWIVSRANNCTYCQGHQEVKLTGDGVKEDTIAALDGDWSEFTPAERAAFAFARKLTYEPHSLTDADIDRLRPHYKDLQILEILMTVAGNNATNRWTGPLAIPQEKDRVFLTPTSEKYRSMRSLVAPLDPASTESACARPASRGPLESRAEVETALEAARKRTARLPLADQAQARAVLPDDWSGADDAPEWARLLGNFPKGGKRLAEAFARAETKGKLSPLLKAKIAWVAARHDRAWYALGHAKKRLNDLGQNDDQIFATDQPDFAAPEPERAALALARKITVDPALVTDADVEAVRQSFSDSETAEVVYLTTQAAAFDRLTEAAGLRLEP
jgi:alkylhydroperoxidase family enzyme